MTGPRYELNSYLSLLDEYKLVVKMLRNEWLRCLTPSGRPKKGPRFYAVGWCTAEDGDQLGIISSGDVKGKRWACKTCLAFMEPVWSDGPLPDDEEIREEWADWMAKGDRKIRTWGPRVSDKDMR